MGYAAAPRVAFIVYGIQTFFTAIIIVMMTTRTGIIIYYNGHRRDALLVRLSQF